MAIECWAENGNVVRKENEIEYLELLDCSLGENLIGDSGELVCVKPFPSMPVSFWNDSTGEKYHRAYFDKFPGLDGILSLFLALKI